MNTLFKIILSLLISITVFQAGLASIQSSPNEYPQIGELAKSLIEVAGIPGLSIAACQNGKLIYAEGFGYADIANKIKMHPNTLLRTASVAKVITVTALGKLASKGKLNFDDPIKGIKINSLGKGVLNLSSSKKSFQSLPIFNLPGQEDYCVVTSFGILFLNWHSKMNKGNIYLYQSRNQENLGLENVIISLQSSNITSTNSRIK